MIVPLNLHTFRGVYEFMMCFGFCVTDIRHNYICSADRRHHYGIPLKWKPFVFVSFVGCSKVSKE